MIPTISLLLCLSQSVFSANILGIVTTPSYSHQIAFQPLWKEVAKLGHQITLISTLPMNHPNITDVNVAFLKTIWEEEFTKTATQWNPIKVVMGMGDIMLKLQNETIYNEDVNVVLKSGKFDLVLTEIQTNGIAYGVARKSNCPIIIISSLDLPNFGHAFFGNPTNLAVYTSTAMASGATFTQRLINVLLFTIVPILFDSYVKRKELKQLARIFGENPLTTLDLSDNVSLGLLNVNPAYYFVRPLSPGTVFFGGGIHIGEEKELPKDIKDFLDKAEIIYFSLGTNVKAKDLTPEMLQAFLDTFQKLPYQILWKYDKELLAIPPNVKVLKWIPQADVLRHKNVKLFITQGGLQSMEEAIFFHVPLVGMPFYLDQETNVRTIVEKKIGLRILPKELDVPTFTKTILEVISNPTYKKNMEKLAKLALDQPMSGLEKAVWWTEYVLRHKGAKHLRRPLSEQLPMYQYLLLDVLAFVLGVLFTIVFILYKIYRFFRPKKIVRFFDDKKIN